MATVAELLGALLRNLRHLNPAAVAAALILLVLGLVVGIESCDVELPPDPPELGRDLPPGWDGSPTPPPGFDDRGPAGRDEPPPRDDPETTGHPDTAEERAEFGEPGRPPESTAETTCDAERAGTLQALCSWDADDGSRQSDCYPIYVVAFQGFDETLRSHCQDSDTKVMVHCERDPPYTSTHEAPSGQFCYFGSFFFTATKNLKCRRLDLEDEILCQHVHDEGFRHVPAT